MFWREWEISPNAIHVAFVVILAIALELAIHLSRTSRYAAPFGVYY